MKYVFPAILTEEPEGVSVRFPDINGCHTSGVTLVEALEMAGDALALMLYQLEEDGATIPSPTSTKKLAVNESETVSLVTCDTLEYRMMFDNRAVKKTLTIPSWLNTLAERNEVNFSATLQTALKQSLNVK